MLQIYIDDSGKERVSPSQVLAGYMASDIRWSDFCQEWNEILAKVDLASFHMVDAWRMSRSYKTLGVLGRNQLVADLLGCISRHVDHAFVLSIDLEAFIHWFGRDEITDFRATRPYFFGFHSVLNMVCDHIYRLRDDQDFMVYFDEQGGESARHTLGAVNLLKDAAVEHGRDHMRIPTPTYLSDDLNPPLQAADMLAWLCRREDFNHRNNENWRDKSERIWLDSALDMPHTVKLFGDKELEAISSDVARKIRTR